MSEKISNRQPTEKGRSSQEQLASWLVPEPKEFKEIKNGLLKMEVLLLGRHGDKNILTPDRLEKAHERIDRLISSEAEKKGVDAANILLAEATPWMKRIEDKHAKLTRILEEKRESLFTQQFPERKASFRELPLHIGAVFKDGRNWLQVEHESIPILDIKNEKQRETYMLENIHAFDVLFKQPASWKPAVDIWLADAKFAADAGKLSKETYEAFEQKLKAFMAVTASVRAMEESAGATPTYLAVLTGGEKGNLDAQDTMPDYLLHGSPENLNRVLEDPLVAKFYEKIMSDAGLIDDKDHRWRKHEKDEDKYLPSKLELRQGVNKQDVRKGELVKYLKDESEEGGLDKYIANVLLKLRVGEGFSDDARWAAAKLACDAFVADWWTRWEEEIDHSKEELDTINKTKTEGEKEFEGLELTPIKEWGGNPLKSISKPSFLPRLKKVYTGKDKIILDLMDKAFRPLDIFRGDDLEEKLVVPSLVTNMKKIARITDAMSRFTGDSMSSGIPSWENIVVGENLPKIEDLLVQVYGRVKDRGKPIGKEIVGAMMMRLLHTKALATMIETGKPGAGDVMQIIFDPQNRERPYLEIMKFLYGPRLDGKAGFIQTMIGGRNRLIVSGNRFGAEKEYQKIYEILQKNDELGRGVSAKTLNKIGLAIDTLSAFSVFAKR